MLKRAGVTTERGVLKRRGGEERGVVKGGLGGGGGAKEGCVVKWG